MKESPHYKRSQVPVKGTRRQDSLRKASSAPPSPLYLKAVCAQSADELRIQDSQHQQCRRVRYGPNPTARKETRSSGRLTDPHGPRSGSSPTVKEGLVPLLDPSLTVGLLPFAPRTGRCALFLTLLSCT